MDDVNCGRWSGGDERSGARLGSYGRGTGVFVRMFTCKRAVEQGDTTPVCPQEIGIIETDSYSDKYRPRDEPLGGGGVMVGAGTAEPYW
jgi:hypothetical protein